jgi:serine/threonine-protein kinase
MSFDVGDQLGDYTIVGILGSGGMGQVFRVEHNITKRLEAAKILAQRAAPDTDQAQRFLREIQVHASLNHPNIATVHNAFCVGEDLVMVLELVRGNSLETLLAHGALPLADGLDYICQALCALGYAHERGVVHRDITPSNLIVAPDGTVKLTDFGLAMARGVPRVTLSGMALGSPYYMSPEQVRGSTDLDPRSDIYSMGAVLYEVVTGRKPFLSDNTYAAMLAQVEQMPPAPTAINPALPPVLDEVVLKAMAKEPAERFESADELRKPLERLWRTLNGFPEEGAVATPEAPLAIEPAPVITIPVLPPCLPPPASRPSRWIPQFQFAAGVALVAVPLALVGVLAPGARQRAAIRAHPVQPQALVESQAAPAVAPEHEPAPPLLAPFPKAPAPAPRPAVRAAQPKPVPQAPLSLEPKVWPPTAVRAHRLQPAEPQAAPLPQSLETSPESEVQRADDQAVEAGVEADTAVPPSNEQKPKQPNRFWRTLGRIVRPSK